MQATSPPPFRANSPPQTNGLPLPPEKRQKLSHGPSPLATSHSPGGYYSPYSPQWSPHTTQPPPLHPQPQPHQPPPSVSFYPPNPLESFNQPQPVQAPAFEMQNFNQQPTSGRGNNAGTMGPPERPQKPVDPNDITDMVALSGVDLRAEEEAMMRATFNTSFDTQGNSTQSLGGSFNQWSQGNYGSQPAFNAGAPFNQRPVTEVSLEEQLRLKHKEAARDYARSKEAHLRDPFLAAQPVRDRIHRRAYEEHVRFNTNGIRDEAIRAPGDVRPQDVRASHMLGKDEKGLVAAQVRHVVEQDSPVVEVLSLLSLACNERLRATLEDAFAVARARQYGSQGVVPPEWKDIAQGPGAAENTTATSRSITNTAWDKPPESATSPSNSQPRPSATTNDDPTSTRLPTPPTETSPPPQPTVSFNSPLPPLLINLAEADRAAEKARLEKRKARLARADGTDASASATPAPSAAAAVDEPTQPVKMTKKMMAAEKKNSVNDEVQRKQANATANMALGGGGKKYSWLSGKGGASTGGLAAGAGMGRGVGSTPKSSAPSTPGPAAGPAKQAVAEDPGMRGKEGWKKLGTWREDAGVSMKDLVGVLERDGLEKRTLARCLVRLRSDEKENTPAVAGQAGQAGKG